MPTDRPYIFLTCDSKHTYIFVWPYVSTPYESYFKMPYFHVVSYAFSRSKKIDTCSFLATTFWINVSKWTRWSKLLLPWRNSYLHIGLKKSYKTSIYHSLHGLTNVTSKCNRPIIWRFRIVFTRFGIGIKLANFQNEFNYMLMSAAIMQQYAIEMMYVWFVTNSNGAAYLQYEYGICKLQQSLLNAHLPLKNWERKTNLIIKYNSIREPQFSSNKFLKSSQLQLKIWKIF